jgi:hypothetical protein
MDGIHIGAVLDAAVELLDAGGRTPKPGGG